MNPVKISGSKRTHFGPPCNDQDEDWEDTTQMLARTLEMALMVMIEDGEEWKMIKKQ